MSVETKAVLPKFPLRILPSVRQKLDVYAAREGVSLNQFINVAVAEKVARLQHEEWLANRKKPNAKDLAEALALLNKNVGQAPEPGDEIPAEYLAARKRALLPRLKRA